MKNKKRDKKVLETSILPKCKVIFYFIKTLISETWVVCQEWVEC